MNFRNFLVDKDADSSTPFFSIFLIWVLVMIGWMIMLSNRQMLEMSEHSRLHLNILSWCVMVIAMMFPALAPSTAQISRFQKYPFKRIASQVVFLSGYLIVWIIFGLILAALSEWMQPAINVKTRAIALVSSGVFQFTPAKKIFLQQCQLEVQCSSVIDSFLAGIEKGLSCLGCCWVLMILMFVWGIHDLTLMVAMTLLMSVERMTRGGLYFAYIGGVILLLFGGFLMLFGY